VTPPPSNDSAIGQKHVATSTLPCIVPERTHAKLKQLANVFIVVVVLSGQILGGAKLFTLP